MSARHARAAREAADAAPDLGFPVVLKVLSGNIVHIRDIGSVTSTSPLARLPK